MLRLAFAHFIRLCRLNISFFILSLVCLTCAFTSFLFIQEFGYYKYTEVIEREQETQVLYFMCSDDTTAQDVYFRLDSDRFFPELSSVTMSSDQYAGIDWGESGDWYTPYGRFFRYEEIESGAAAAILGTCYIQSLPQESIDSVWETEIEINGTHFDAIGSHYFHTSADGAVPKELYATQIPAPIVIPLRSFWEEGLAANKLRCVFSKSADCAAAGAAAIIRRDSFRIHAERRQLLCNKGFCRAGSPLYAHHHLIDDQHWGCDSALASQRVCTISDLYHLRCKAQPNRLFIILCDHHADDNCLFLRRFHHRGNHRACPGRRSCSPAMAVLCGDLWKRPFYYAARGTHEGFPAPYFAAGYWKGKRERMLL